MEPRPPDPRQADGYLVVLKPELAFASWRRGTTGEGFETYWSQLRAALPDVVPERYAGIARFPIDRWWKGDEGIEPPGPNTNARRRIFDLFGPDPTLHHSAPPAFDPDLLPSVELAEEIRELSDDPSRYEVLRVTRRTGDVTEGTLGFDVGYWGSDHFSALCDAMMMPRWHGAPLEAFEALRAWSAKLTPAQLFTTAENAGDFRTWYLAQPWAELEGYPGEIEVIRVDASA